MTTASLIPPTRTPHTPTPQERARASYLNLTLWTFQGWLAMFFVAAGYAKLTESSENLTVLMQWPDLVPLNLVRTVGAIELTLALMMLTPLVSWRLGRPLVLASAGILILWQALMLGVHLIGLDIGLSLTNLFLLAITAPVLWFRRRS